MNRQPINNTCIYQRASFNGTSACNISLSSTCQVPVSTVRCSSGLFSSISNFRSHYCTTTGLADSSHTIQSQTTKMSRPIYSFRFVHSAIYSLSSLNWKNYSYKSLAMLTFEVLYTQLFIHMIHCPHFWISPYPFRGQIHLQPNSCVCMWSGRRIWVCKCTQMFPWSGPVRGMFSPYPLSFWIRGGLLTNSDNDKKQR